MIDIVIFGFNAATLVDYLKPSVIKQPAVEHHRNCICSQKSWGDESQCSCGLTALRQYLDPFLPKGYASERWNAIIAEGKWTDEQRKQNRIAQIKGLTNG